MRRTSIVFQLSVFMLCLAVSAVAHDVGAEGKVVIDTDMGIDDAVALALALQDPHMDISAIVFAEGAAGETRGYSNLGRMAALFNRSDIKLYGKGETTQSTPPQFRDFAERSVADALTDVTQKLAILPFAPEAYTAGDSHVVVLALGPLTNIAQAMKERPEIREKIALIVCAGDSEPEKNWNLRFNLEAFKAVKASGVKLEFIDGDDKAARKPDAWKEGELKFGPRTSIGEEFVRRMLEQPAVRAHYLERFATFSDELVVMFAADHSLFWDAKQNHVWRPNDRASLNETFTKLLTEGRQGKDRVVLIPGTLPDEILQPDLRARKAEIVAKNGETEWFAQLLLNELHEHLGAYSIIGVKMGLRAAELLNAPQHEMMITSYTPGRPPFSCMNDGMIVSTGCTPGRMLFRHEPVTEPGPVSAMFEYNGRRLVLSLKPEYQAKVKSRFEEILSKSSEVDHDYWHEVRDFGLEIWEDWSRREIFDVNDVTRKAALE